MWKSGRDLCHGTRNDNLRFFLRGSEKSLCLKLSSQGSLHVHLMAIVFSFKGDTYQIVKYQNFSSFHNIHSSYWSFESKVYSRGIIWHTHHRRKLVSSPREDTLIEWGPTGLHSTRRETLGGCRTPQYRRKYRQITSYRKTNWQISQYRIESRWNTEIAKTWYKAQPFKRL